MTPWVALCLTIARAGDAEAPSLSRVLERESRVFEAWYPSAVLHREMPLSVVVPVGYDPDGKPSPVVVFLHGNGRHHRSLLDVPATREALLAVPFVTVHPNGLTGWYIDSPVDPEAVYQRALTEATAVAQRHYNLSGRRELRGIGGWSMGGYGAARYLVDFPNSFGALGTLIGCLDFPNAALPADQNHSVPEHFGPSEGWDALNPIRRVERLDGVRLWQATATDAFDRTMNEHWRDRLLELGYDNTFVMLDGGHTWPVVEAGLPGVLSFFAERFERVRE